MLSQGESAAVRAEAWRVLQQNRRRGVSTWDGRPFDYVCPSVEQYPFQWFWDSCFHAIALAHFDVELACRELDGLLGAASPSGFIPHIIFWERERFARAIEQYNVVFSGSHTTATIQPPVLALALERLADAGAPADWLRPTLATTLAYHRWLAAKRDPDGDGLIAILQPDESGLDAAPKYDLALQLARVDRDALREAMERLFSTYAPLRGEDPDCLALDHFQVEDVLVNVIWLEALRALARLIARFGLPSVPAAQTSSIVHELAALADRGRDALLERSYDPQSGTFYDLVGHAEQPSRVLTVSSIMPLYLADLPAGMAERLVHEHLVRPDRFWLPYPLPSVAASEPSFEPDFASTLVWRGPTWMNTNWFAVHGLRRHGYLDLAEQLAERSARLVLQSGLRECYNPYTATGYGAPDFAWSALVVDLLPDTPSGYSLRPRRP